MFARFNVKYIDNTASNILDHSSETAQTIANFNFIFGLKLQTYTFLLFNALISFDGHNKSSKMRLQYRWPIILVNKLPMGHPGLSISLNIHILSTTISHFQRTAKQFSIALFFWSLVCGYNIDLSKAKTTLTFVHFSSCNIPKLRRIFRNPKNCSSIVISTV